MRTIKLFSWVLLGSLIAHFAPVAAAQSTAAGGRVPGHVVAARVVGSVTATQVQTNLPLKVENNTILGQNYVINTGAGSSVILVFSNGASVNLGAESSLSIDEFVQEPLEKELAVTDLEEEPSTSVTKLNLTRGELVGSVKKIHEDRGSSFTVNTPVGAAGIRGTTFRIVFRPTASGRVFFTLSTAEGRVVYEAPISRAVSAVPTGQEIVVSVDVQVNQATGTVSVTAPPVVTGTQPIPPATQAAIAVASQQIIQATSALVISSTVQAQDDQAAAEKAAAEKDAADKAATEKAAAERAASEKAAADKAAQEKAAADKAAAEKSGQSEGEKTGEPAAEGKGTPADESKAPAGEAKSGDSSGSDTPDAPNNNDNGRLNPLDSAPPPAPPTPAQQTTSGDGRAR